MRTRNFYYWIFHIYLHSEIELTGCPKIQLQFRIYLIVKVLLMLVVYFGYALQQYIIVELVWPSLRDSHALSKRPPNHTVIAEYSFRATLVLAASITFWSTT